MSDTPGMVEKRVRLPVRQVGQLWRLARAQRVSEDEVIARALDLLFSHAGSLDAEAAQRGWDALSEDAFGRVWDNDEDAVHDDWRERYGVPVG